MKVVRFIVLTTSLFLVQQMVYSQQDLTDAEKRLRYTIGALAHDSMFGREAGKPAEKVAANFIADYFKQIGLQPVPGSSGYLRPFKFNNYSFLKTSLSINGQKFRSGIDFGAIAGSSDGKIQSGEIIVLQDPASELLNPNAGFRDKVILINMRGETKKERYSLQQSLELVEKAALSGAGAVLLYNAAQEDYKDRLFNADSIPSFTIPVLYLTRNVLQVLNKLTEPKCDIQVKIDRERPEAVNVVAFKDNHAKQTVVIGGHFDHVGTPGADVPEVGNPNIHNGADDNASGTAGVMELAHWASHQNNLKYNYLFIAFSAEEKGLYGSWNFCNSPEFRNFDFAWMLNLDMIGRLGWSGKNKLTQLAFGSSSKWRKLVRQTDHKGMTLMKLKGAPAFSDHHPFIKHHVPVLYYTTGLEKEYHKPVDDPELINYSGEAKILAYIENVIINAEGIGDPGFRHLNGWQNFWTTARVFVFR